MKNQARTGNFPRFVVWAALAMVLLIGCGGGGGGGASGGAGLPDSVAPAVASSVPMDGATDVAIDESLEIAFTEPVDPATANGTTVKIRVGDTEMAGTVCCAHDTITFTPATNWGFATTYTVTISGGVSGVKDLAGNALAADHTWTFSTGQAPDTNPPTVTATNPINGATGVSVQTSVTAIFSEAVTNVSPAAFRLAAGGVPVPGGVTTNGSTAIFTPSTPLLYNTTYTATAAAGVADLAGNPLRAEVNWTFTTSEMSGSANVISSGTDSASGAQLSMDASGTAVAVWVQGNGIWSNRYVPGTGWGAATAISSGTGGAEVPQVAMGGSGTATAVWRQWDGAEYSIYANRYLPGTGWGTATIIERGEGQAGGVTKSSISLGGPQVGMDTSGNAIAVWPQWDGGAWSIYANRYAPGIGWGTEALIESGLNNTYDPKMAMDRTGTAIAVWRDVKEGSSGPGGSVYANRYEPGIGWGIVTRMDNALGYALGPDVALGGSGDAIAVWNQVNPNPSWNGICARRYEPGRGWGTETVVAEGGGPHYVTLPRVALAGAGIAVVWEEGIIYGGGGYSIPYETRSIGVSNYMPLTGWMAPALISSTEWYTDSAQVAMGSNGNALAVWRRRDGYTIYANRYVSGTGWQAASVVETAGGEAFLPRVATDSNGNYLIVWQQWDGTRFNISAVRDQVP